MNDYEFYENLNVSCEKCTNDKAFLWFDKNEKVYLISCDNCGVNERNEKGTSTTAVKNKKNRCFAVKALKNSQMKNYILIKIQECLRLEESFFHHFENSPNPVVEQIKFCPFCGVKFDVVGVGLDN